MQAAINVRANHNPFSKIGGWGAMLSALFFVVVTVYLFGYLTTLGFSTEMLDDPALLYPWVAQNGLAYEWTWLFYFLSQFFLLPLPIALNYYFQRLDPKPNGLSLIATVFGVVAIAIAMLSPIIFFATASPTAKAYSATAVSDSQAMMLMVGTLFADLAKYVRLFSEILLSVWLAAVAILFLNRSNARPMGWVTLLVAGWTFAIVSTKLFFPYNPLEDFLGLILAAVYGMMGIWLLRQK